MRLSSIHPVPVMRAAIAFEPERRARRRAALRGRVLGGVAAGQDLHRAVLVAARQFDMPRQIALEDARVGMVKTVAIAYRSARLTKPP